MNSLAGGYQDIVDALDSWRQGDCALDVSGFIYRFTTQRPVTQEAYSAADESDVVEADVPGFVILTQTCDIRRDPKERPFVEICALVACPEWTSLDEIRKGLRPRFAYVPGVADRSLVADLDQVMTVEKPVLAYWPRVPGCLTDVELRGFAVAISRKFSRFAFPDDFVEVARKLVELIKRKHGKLESDEGKALRELREIRIAATPDWNADHVNLFFFFIRREEQSNAFSKSWAHWLTKWLSVVAPSGRYVSIEGVVLPLSEIRADEYVASDQLDLDNLSNAN